jgi:hypothetical protein
MVVVQHKVLVIVALRSALVLNVYFSTVCVYFYIVFACFSIEFAFIITIESGHNFFTVDFFTTKVDVDVTVNQAFESDALIFQE